MYFDYLTQKCGSMPKLANRVMRDLSSKCFRTLVTRNNLMLITVGTTVYVLYKINKVNVETETEFIPKQLGGQDNLAIAIARSCKQRVTSYYDDIRMKIIVYSLRLINNYNINTKSKLIEEHIERPNGDMRHALLNVRDEFRTYPMASAEIHSHPISAVNRSAMATFMADIAARSGFRPYHVSRARTDLYLGCRYFYNVKDLSMQWQDDTIPTDAAIIMTDVDYYADMNKWLMLWRPILLYTFVPTKMSGQTAEYAYHFDGDEVVYEVKGGATYTHKLWVYEGDTVVVDSGDAICTYNIEQRSVPDDADHRYICLTPASRIKYPYAKLIPQTENQGIRRFKNEGYLYDSITDKLSIIASSKHHAVNITGQVFEAIKERMANKTAPPIIADVERILKDSNFQDPHLNAPLLFNHLNSKIDRNVIFTSSLVSYHPLPEGAMTNEDGDPMGTNATSNLVFPGAAYPTNSHASDLATVHGRVDSVRNSTDPPTIYNVYANNFISQLVRHSSTGVPYTAEQVVREQDGVMQRARNQAILHTVTDNATNRLQAFIKAEPYSTANDPRNITTMAPQLTLMMSRYTYAFKNDVLKNTRFYSPGMTPDEIVTRLGELTKTSGVLCTDYSRFDGTISKWLQKYVVKAAYKRWLTFDNHGSFNKWFDKIFTRRATTRHGVNYDPGWGTRSGSPITTDGNTMINAFVMFVAFIKLGLSIPDAFEAIGLYCGDDGYTTNRDGLIHAVLETARELGLTAECTIYKEGPYPFCGRLFVDPSLIPDSFQDLKRTLPKLHLVNNGPESIEQRITNKATGYMVTDSKTPILSVWAKKLLSLTALEAKHVSHEEAYKMNHPWPQQDTEKLMEAVMKHLDMTSIEIRQMESMIQQTTSLTDFPVIAEWTPDSKITAVRGDIIENPRRNHISRNNASRQETTSRRRNQRAQGTNRPAQQTEPSNTNTQRVATLVPPLVGGSGVRSSQPNGSTSESTPPIHSQTARSRATSS